MFDISIRLHSKNTNKFEKIARAIRLKFDFETIFAPKLHRLKIKQAKRVYKLLNSNRFSSNSPGSIFSYLRKIDPFVFEELLLIAFKHKGYKVIRNKAYTGDGGIDGRLILKSGEHVAIQAKRYKSHINPSHVAKFDHLVSKQFNFGLFIHTGKTGGLSYKNCNKNVQIISGKSLIDLILN